MNYQHLKYFQMVAREENFLRASEKLFITQSALSRAIANLEEELGVELFERTGRSIHLTSYGKKFLEHIDEAMQIINRGIDEVHNMMGSIKGTINLSCIYGYTYHYLPNLISEYNKLYPDVRFLIKADTTNAVLSQIYTGECDMGIHSETQALDRFSSLDTFPFHKEEVVVIVPPAHPLAKNESCSLSELQKERFVSFDHNSGMLYVIQEIFSQAGLTFSPYTTVSDDQSIINMVRGGVAIACVLRNIAEHSGCSVLTISDDVDKYMNVHLTVKHKPHYSATVSSFLDFLLTHNTSD